MDYKILFTVFITVFIAELGDKTQLATMLFASGQNVSRWSVFWGSALALITTSALGVLAGGIISKYLSEKHLSIVAGVGFIAVGVWTLIKVFYLANKE
ncbi:MAG: TMEM165/GDT1 family protein [Acidobacteria bacterium]|nr:TMEM165/GDT1 family protein [Acidobacteriota bacterium]